MQYIIYIGAALFIGLLIGFVALAVNWLRKTMLRNVRSHTLGLISVYDDILDEKSRELASFEEELKIREEDAASDGAEQQAVAQTQAPSGIAPAAILAIAEQAAEASYRDETLGITYHQIRKSFAFRVDEILPSMASVACPVGGPAGRILDSIGYETAYRLSTLPQKEQREILLSSLDGEGVALLEEYLTEHPSFDMLEFYDYLKSRMAEEPKEAKIYVPSGTHISLRARNTAEIAVDEDICEGFQLEMGGKLYDYCIKTKELS